MAIRPFTPFPPPPLKFRTAGFPQYGFKQALSSDLRGSHHLYAVNVAISPVRVFFSVVGLASGGTHRFKHDSPAQWPLAPQRFYCPLTSSLTMTTSEFLPVTTGFWLCQRLWNRQKFPNLLRHGLVPCRRPYSGGSQAS